MNLKFIHRLVPSEETVRSRRRPHCTVQRTPGDKKWPLLRPIMAVHHCAPRWRASRPLAAVVAADKTKWELKSGGIGTEEEEGSVLFVWTAGLGLKRRNGGFSTFYVHRLAGSTALVKWNSSPGTRTRASPARSQSKWRHRCRTLPMQSQIVRCCDGALPVHLIHCHAVFAQLG